MAKLLQLLLLVLCTADGLIHFSATRVNSARFANLFFFQCEDTLTSHVIPDPEYFRNDEPVSITSENFYIFNRMQEGNFSCGRSGGVSESNIITLVAWPDNSIEPINRGHFCGGAGSTVRLDCSITPGVLVEQYYVTWRSASNQSRVFYQSFPPSLNKSTVNIDPQHYTVDPGNFSLYIHNTTPADGMDDYLCILGVEDPDRQGRALIYTKTETFGLSAGLAIHPDTYSFVSGSALAMNGSSRTGLCSNGHQTDTQSICYDVSSSVFFDGIIPTLNFRHNRWASQLFILRPFASSVSSIEFKWSDSMSLSSVEVVLFNCLEWEMAAEAVTLFNLRDGGEGPISSANPNVSCKDLVTVVLPIHSEKGLSHLKLEFTFFRSTDAVSVAEIRFFTISIDCSDDITQFQYPLEVLIFAPLLGCTILALLTAVHTAANFKTRRSRRLIHEQPVIYDEIANVRDICSTRRNEVSSSILPFIVEDDEVNSNSPPPVVHSVANYGDCTQVKIFDISRTCVYDEARDIEPSTPTPYLQHVLTVNEELEHNYDEVIPSASKQEINFYHSLLSTVEEERSHTYKLASDKDIAHTLSITDEKAYYYYDDCVSIGSAQILVEASERGLVYERVPKVNVAELLSNAKPEGIYERAQTYERVPDMNIDELLQEAKERSLVYEQAPKVNVAQLLSNTKPEEIYERAQTYECVPLVDINKLLQEARERVQTHQRTTSVDLAELSSTKAEDIYDEAQTYECVPIVVITDV